MFWCYLDAPAKIICSFLSQISVWRTCAVCGMGAKVFVPGANSCNCSPFDQSVIPAAPLMCAPPEDGAEERRDEGCWRWTCFLTRLSWLSVPCTSGCDRGGNAIRQLYFDQGACIIWRIPLTIAYRIHHIWWGLVVGTPCRHASIVIPQDQAFTLDMIAGVWVNQIRI